MMDPEGAWDSTLMELEGEMVKWLYSSNVSDKTASVATASARTRLGSDGSNESNGGGVNVAWIGGSGKTARQQKNKQQEGNNISNYGGADLTRRKWQ